MDSDSKPTQDHRLLAAFCARRMAALVALLVPAACASDTEVAMSTDPTDETCDITDVECQHKVLSMVAAEREKPVPALPQIRLMPRRPNPNTASRPELIYAEVDADASARLTQRAWDAAHVALRLLPVDLSSRQAEARQRDDQTNRAFYELATRSVVLTERSDVIPADARDEMSQLAHELVHYMQDLDHGIERLYDEAGPDLDGRSSVRTLIEGEAACVGWRIQARLSGKTPDRAAWQNYVDER